MAPQGDGMQPAENASGAPAKAQPAMTPERKNSNRGYMKLVVWQDAVLLYRMTCSVFRSFPYELRRIASQQIASVDSVHRNIAEGYCRRSLREYLQFLNIALSSAGESVSALHAYRTAQQIAEKEFADLDELAYKMENGLVRLIESLQRKQLDGDWQDSFVVRESNCAYVIDPSAPPHHSNLPSPQPSPDDSP